MMEIIQSESFAKWRARLRDRQAQLLIATRLTRLSYGIFGDTAAVGDGVRELKKKFRTGISTVLYDVSRGNCHLALWWRQELAGTRYRYCEAARAPMEAES